jgi:hypothetical protein
MMDVLCVPNEGERGGALMYVCVCAYLRIGDTTNGNASNPKFAYWGYRYPQ